MKPADIRKTIDRFLPETRALLRDMVRFPSTSGREHDLMLFLRDRFSQLPLDVRAVPMDDRLKHDPDYSDPVPGLTYTGRFNLRLCRPGRGSGRKLLFNTHTDVVPPSEDQASPWDSPEADTTAVRGRGACDAKGQIASLYLALRTLDALDCRLAGDVIAHLVNEEENGGNGSLAMVRAGEAADGCVVLEPSDGRLYTSIRGAVWFRVQCRGKAGHSGQAGQTRSALLMARDVIAAFERYHADLLRSSRGFPLFDPYPNPMPITFGKLHAGNWPASAPSQAQIEGVLGFLPNRTKEQVAAEMREVLAGAGDEFFRQNTELGFMYRHDCSVLDPDHELPRSIMKAAATSGAPLEVSAMTASCDAWFYNNLLAIPTVVFGAGSLKVAHSRDEHITLADIGRTAATLVGLMQDYCSEVP